MTDADEQNHATLRREWLLTGHLLMLLALEANGMHRRAAALVDKIGAGLEYERSGAEARRRRLLERSMQAAQVGVATRDPAFVKRIAEIQSKLDRARAVVATPPGKTDRERRKAAKVAQQQVAALTEQLAQTVREEQEQDQLYGEARDPILLAQARGDDVVVEVVETATFLVDDYGARVLERVRGAGIGAKTYLRPVLAYGNGLRARRLGGPEHAFEAGYLAGGPGTAESLLRTAVQYRESYLLGEGQVRGGGGEGGGGYGPKAPQPKRAEAAELLADMRSGLAPRPRAVLDLICGQDLRIGDVRRKLGHGDDRTTARALRQALNAARLAREAAVADRKTRGDDGGIAAQIRLGNRIISQAG